MSDKIRVSVVGTSEYAEFMHLSTLQNHPQVELTAICARNRERAEAMATKYQIPKVFTDYLEMIAQGNQDAIIVAAPDDLHYDITMQALDAGLHVLCEKPLASNAEQAREMFEKAERVGVKHMVTFTYRWMPFFRYVSDLVNQGYLGRCYHCEFRYLARYGRNEKYSWRFDRQRANGALADMGSHMIDLAHWLVGDICRVSAQLGFFIHRVGPDGEQIDPANDSASLLVEFANGAQGMIHLSAVAYTADRGMQQQVYLYGEAGSLEIDVPYYGDQAGAFLRGARSTDEQFQPLDIPAEYWGEVNPTELLAVFTQQLAGPRAFIDAILKNYPATPSFYDGYKVQQVIEAALDAHQSGNWVTIDPSYDMYSKTK